MGFPVGIMRLRRMLQTYGGESLDVFKIIADSDHEGTKKWLLFSKVLADSRIGGVAGWGSPLSRICKFVTGNTWSSKWKRENSLLRLLLKAPELNTVLTKSLNESRLNIIICA